MQRPSLAAPIVLLTHAGNGLGSILAIAFAQAGARIIIHDRSKAVVASAVERLLLAVPGATATGIDAPLDSVEQATALLAQVGSLDILVIDAVSAGVVDFSQVADASSNPRLAIGHDLAQNFIELALPGLAARGAGRAFLLSLSPSSAGPDAGALADRTRSIVVESFGGTQSTSVKVYAVQLPHLILASVADLMKSEVMRTNRLLAEISAQFTRDHRPADIQQASAVILQVVDEVLALSGGGALQKP